MTKVQSTVLSLLEAGTSVTAACSKAGIKRTEFFTWLKDDQEFREAVAHSEAADILAVEGVMFIKAISGSTADRKAYLERREGKKRIRMDPLDEDIEDLQRQLGIK